MMSSAKFIVGDTRDVTATLPDNSVDLILTSPPFLALRSYLPADHPDKWREIGSEASPAAFIDMLLQLTAEWGRVLAPHGSIAVELGDTYAGGGQGPDAKHVGSVRPVAASRGDGWPLDKCKALIPELYRIALAYGINPLTGAESPAGMWRVRNVVTWCRPNPPVGALGDKYRPATSDLVVFTRAANRWFDLDAVRHEPQPGHYGTEGKPGKDRSGNGFRGVTRGPTDMPRTDHHPAGAPPLDYWVIPPGGYGGAHYAVFPAELCRIPIQSMCPRHVCTTCGEPRRRIVEQTPEYAARKALRDGDPDSMSGWDAAVRPGTGGFGSGGGVASRLSNGHISATPVTLGWSDCGHNTWRKGLVFDPFAGSGTTLMVATGNDRDAIGIDLDARNADLAIERLGMFITIEHHTQQVPA